jgi:TolA-binding protein
VWRIIPVALVLVVTAGPLWAQKESPIVASVRKKLQTPVTVDYKETPLHEVVDDLKSKVDDLSIYIDNNGGVSNNQSITYSATDKPLDQVLDEIGKKATIGYVIARPGGRYPSRYNGWVIITKSAERGDEAGSAAATTKPEKPATREKPTATAKPPVPPEDEAAKAEKEAATKLMLAKDLFDDGRVDKAKEWLQTIVKDYGKTKAADQARQMLEKLNK